MDVSIEVDTNTFKPNEWKRSEADSGVHRRIIKLTRNYFRQDANPERIDPLGDLNHRLPLGEIESLALPYESYQAAFTNSMLQQVYGDRISDINVAGEAGYHPHTPHHTAEGQWRHRELLVDAFRSPGI